MNDCLRMRIWYTCENCGGLIQRPVIVGNEIVQDTGYSTQPCPEALESHPLCRLRQDGDYEPCTGMKDSDETLIFAGDRVGTDETWAEVAWQAVKGQWFAGGVPLWLELERGAKVLGNSHKPDQTAKTTERPHE